ncbi:hypothetical protein [Aliikangiella maris]|uniref:Uncharacterized protein n=2 Tax=Aliikangiella maris TaxID=3162458 RepID=A0ABV3MJL8_9GAMM
MLLKVKVLFSVFVFTILFSTLVSALEPLKENRARIFALKATLLLPEYEFLDVDMSFDCGSKYESTAMIITSFAGAQLLAASYTHLYGKEAGEMVMQTWQNKVNKDDPRLPTFIFVSPATGTHFDWRQSVKVTTNKNLSQTGFSLTTRNNSADGMPNLYAGCGSRTHHRN